MAAVHLAIVNEGVIQGLLSGRKQIETRFYRRKRVPFDKIARGDVIHFKRSGGEVIGTSRVDRVRQFENLTPRRVDQIRRSYSRRVAAPGEYWRERRHCRYGVLIWLGDLAPASDKITVPRQFGAGWVLLRDG